MRAVSLKRQRLLRQRRKLTDAMKREGFVQCAMCGGRADDLHELVSRARGGSITDPENTVPLCRPCHSRVTTEPAWAEANGWARRAHNALGHYAQTDEMAT